MSQTLSQLFNIKAVFIDVDGTAVLSEERNREAIEHVARAGGHDIQPEDWATLAGAGDEVIWERIVDLNAEFKNSYPTADDFESACVDGYNARKDEVRVNQAVLDAVTSFIDAGIDTAAVSNSLHDVVKTNLDVAGYDRSLLRFVLTKTEVREKGLKPKPDPAPYVEALRMLNEIRARDDQAPVNASECLILEDSLTGVRAALKAGMRVLHIRDDSAQLPAAETQRLEDKFNGHYYSCDLNTVPIICQALQNGIDYPKNNPAVVKFPQNQQTSFKPTGS